MKFDKQQVDRGIGLYSEEMDMRRLQAWQVLCVIFAAFWLIFAVVLIVFSQFPFYVISIALTTVLVMSVLIVALAWAYTHDF